MHKRALLPADASGASGVHPLITFHVQAPKWPWICRTPESSLRVKGWRKSHPYVVTWTETETGGRPWLTEHLHTNTNLMVPLTCPKGQTHSGTHLWRQTQHIITQLIRASKMTAQPPPPLHQQPILSCVRVSLFPGSPRSLWKPWFSWNSWKEGMTSRLFYFSNAKCLFHVSNHCDIWVQILKKRKMVLFWHTYYSGLLNLSIFHTVFNN